MSTHSTLTDEAGGSERDALLNPALLAVLLAQAAAGHRRRTDAPMPMSLAFLAAPIVLHGPTRRALPTRVTAKPGAWLDDHPLLRAGFAVRARSVAPAVRAGMREGLRAGVLELVGDSLVGHPPKRSAALKLSSEVDEIFKRAEFVGGWLGLAGPPVGSFAMWRVRP